MGEARDLDRDEAGLMPHFVMQSGCAAAGKGIQGTARVPPDPLPLRFAPVRDDKGDVPGADI